MYHLLLSFLALLLGPLLVLLARRHAWSSIAVDSFCVITISGFALLHLLPECYQQAGWPVLPLALLGFIAPTLAERGLARESPHLRRVVLGLALLGMAAHDTLDGLFLAGGHHHHGPGEVHDHSHADVTAWAIILHRIPEGVGIWWIVPRTLGMRATILVSIVTITATIAGFVFHGALTPESQSGLALLQSALAGSLLHVVFHAHIPAPKDRGNWHFASVGGAALAVFVLWFVIHDHFPAGENHQDPWHVFLTLATESAPALLLAYALVGVCHAFLPAGWLAGMTRGSTLSQALRGVAVGLPLPVCSCGVVPIYRELVRQGAALAAAIAFLIATPELELAAVMLTWQLMGGEVAAVRVAMAAVLALSVGMLVAWLAPRDATTRAQQGPGQGALPAGQQGTVGQRLKEAFRFGYGPAVDNTATWILMGLLLSALMMPYVDREWIASLPAGIDVPVAALIGLPLYVCATGSTPLAAILLMQGMSPGAVLALLLTGPATNITTFGMLARLHGKRVAALFALTMWLGAVGLGYGVNWLLPGLPRPTIPPEGHEHGTEGMVWLALLGGVFLLSLLRQGVRPFLERLFESPANVGHIDAHGCCGDGHDHGDDHRHHHHGHGSTPGPAPGVFDAAPDRNRLSPPHR
ncbi:MAG: permease [Planctomycetes bacterium]|nr:permease [Planctomycetota bacterium]